MLGHTDATDQPDTSSVPPAAEATDRAEPTVEMTDRPDVVTEPSAAPSPTSTARPADDAFSESDDGLVTFGRSARLRPVPGRVAAQRPRALEHVPDTAMDWIDLDSAGLSVRALSARGHMHRYLGEVRQDSFAIEVTPTALIVAVADGVGSSSASHLGSALAARNAVRHPTLAAQVLSAADGGSTKFGDIAVMLEHEASQLGLTARDVSTTLVLAVISTQPGSDGSYSVAIAQIGDSTAWRSVPEGWHPLGATDEPEDDGSRVLSTAVEPLPEHATARVWREAFDAGESLALVSDGVGNILSAQASYAAELSSLWAGSAPSLSSLLKIVDATVKSYDDDRTLVGVRFR